MKPISFIATDAPAATKSFYKDILGLELVAENQFALVFLDAEHMLRIQIVPSLKGAEHTVYGWQVEDIDKTVEDLAAKGVMFETFAHLVQNEVGVWQTPDGSQVAWFRDPAGNVLSVTQFAD